MMWLVLEDPHTHKDIPFLLEAPVYRDFSYPLLPAGVDLLLDWHSLGWADDHHSGGVLADWLEDHRSELLTGATGPSDPSIRLQQLIDYLRSRFHRHQ